MLHCKALAMTFWAVEMVALAAGHVCWMLFPRSPSHHPFLLPSPIPGPLLVMMPVSGGFAAAVQLLIVSRPAQDENHLRYNITGCRSQYATGKIAPPCLGHACLRIVLVLQVAVVSAGRYHLPAMIASVRHHSGHEGRVQQGQGKHLVAAVGPSCIFQQLQQLQVTHLTAHVHSGFWRVPCDCLVGRA